MNKFETVSTSVGILILAATSAIAGQISVINPAAGGGLAGTPVAVSPPTVSPSAGASSGASHSVQGRSMGIVGRDASILERLSSIDTSGFTSGQRLEAVAILSSLLADRNFSDEIRQFLEMELQRLKP